MAQMGSVKGYVGLKWPSGWSRGGGTGSDRIDCRVYMGSKGVVWCVGLRGVGLGAQTECEWAWEVVGQSRSGSEG